MFLVFVSLLFSCEKENEIISSPDDGKNNFISAVDISSFPEISKTNPIFYDEDGNKIDFLTFLKENGVNTIRLRLWVHPDDEHSGFEEVKQFSSTLKSKGFKIWLTVHYSDTWADPSQQTTPADWQQLSFEALTTEVYNYTKDIMKEIQPDFIQIGNEINNGFLHPYGHISSNQDQFLTLMEAGISAVRQTSDKTKIIIHYAGFENSDWFFETIKSLDYDIIGLSYYPIWHGKSITALEQKMSHLSTLYNKDVVIAETAYPFTLDWNDWTNNIIGSDEQLILPEYPASSQGQMQFISEIKSIVKKLDKGLGFCYWGAELIAWKGQQSTDGSPWENQALFDFENKALPVIFEFSLK